MINYRGFQIEEISATDFIISGHGEEGEMHDTNLKTVLAVVDEFVECIAAPVYVEADQDCL